MNIILLSQHPPFNPHGHVSGEQIRAEHLRLALEAKSHSVHRYCTDELPPSAEARLDFLNAQSADAVISLSIELSAELSGLTIPHVLDSIRTHTQDLHEVR